MRLGLLADIHEDVERLDLAVARLEALGVDRFVVLGDIFDRGDLDRLDAVAARLEAIDAEGVWGNHDIGLCNDPPDDLASRYTPRTRRYMARLRARLVVDGCLFSHIEPALDPALIEDLWSCEPLPDTPERAAPSFAAWPHRWMLMGHIHRWLAVRPDRTLDWSGEAPLVLTPPDRYLVVVHAVCDGWCAHLDTATNVLTPVNLDA